MLQVAGPVYSWCPQRVAGQHFDEIRYREFGRKVRSLPAENDCRLQ